MGFGNKSSAPFRNIPANGMSPPTLNDTGHTRPRQNAANNGMYKWLPRFDSFKVGDSYKVVIKGHHEFAYRNPQFSEKEVIATVWDINVKDKIIWFTVKGEIGTIKVSFHFIAVFDPNSICYVSHNGVRIRGKYEEKTK